MILSEVVDTSNMNKQIDLISEGYKCVYSCSNKIVSIYEGKYRKEYRYVHVQLDKFDSSVSHIWVKTKKWV